MSFASERYAQNATFFTKIKPGEDWWDRTIHAHTTEEMLLLTEEGNCTVICNGDVQEIKTPAFIWNRAGSYHLVSNDMAGKEISYAISFPPKLLDEVSTSQRYYSFIEDYAMFALPVNAEQLERLKKLFDALIGSPIAQRPLLVACVAHQIRQYLKTGVSPICSSSSYSYIFKVIAALEQMKTTGLTTAALAERFHVGKTKLEEDFKNCTGHTIHVFRLRSQLQAARLQLITTDHSLSQIANDCGFTDHSHLIHCFRAEYGTTPGRYRKEFKHYPLGF